MPPRRPHQRSFDRTRPGTWTRAQRVAVLRELANEIVEALSHPGIVRSNDVYVQALADADVAAEDLRQLIDSVIGR